MYRDHRFLRNRTFEHLYRTPQLDDRILVCMFREITWLAIMQSGTAIVERST
jgi:hypothetical protein